MSKDTLWHQLKLFATDIFYKTPHRPSRSRYRPPSELESRGQIMTKAPIFAENGAEIMSVKRSGRHHVLIFFENMDHDSQPGELLTSLMTRRDYRQLIRSQTPPQNQQKIHRQS